MKVYIVLFDLCDIVKVFAKLDDAQAFVAAEEHDHLDIETWEVE